MKTAFLTTLALALAAYLALPMPGETKRPLSERIESAERTIERTRAREGVLTDTIEGLNGRITSLQGEIGGLVLRERRIQLELSQTEAELEALRDKLDAARARVAQLKKELAVAEAALANRLVELYKADEPDAVTVVLEADGFADLLEQTEFLERISEQDGRVVGRVRALKAEAKREATVLAGLEHRTELAANAIRARRDELAQARTRLEASRSALEETRDGRRAVLASVQSSRRAAEEDLDAMQAQQARIAAALREQAAQSSASAASGAPVRQGSGQLAWPVSGQLTSPFGMRWGRLHAGIDISAPTGTPIRAADSGRVALAGWTGGYGMYTCIQHTSSMSTCYAHQSSIGVGVGQSVGQGQVIGAVGNSGNSTGAHLHFEVRLGGSPVNPLGYL